MCQITFIWEIRKLTLQCKVKNWKETSSFPTEYYPGKGAVTLGHFSRNLSRNFVVLLRAMRIVTKTLGDKFILGHVTPGNDSCKFCRNGVMKLREKFQDKLPSITAP